MDDADTHADLTGKLLIAMPDMGDPRFHGSVIFLCAHSEEGAMGLIVNKPMVEVSFADMLDQLDIDGREGAPDVPVTFGGPVDLRRGFVLHSAEYTGHQNDILRVDDRFAMTATMDVLEDIANRRGPDHALMALGYASWGPGQLEDEIQQNGWLTADATPDLVFGPQMDTKWEGALALLGVHPLTLSSEAGHA